jgi:hypothetical protein
MRVREEDCVNVARILTIPTELGRQRKLVSPILET